MTHLEYMKKACQLALKGKGKTSPNPLVGAIVVRNGRVVGQGWHQRAGGPHAEVIALRKAGRRAQKATLYVTLEPCCHHGRTPPCVDKVIASGVKEVMMGMKDPNPLVKGRSVNKLRRAGIKVRIGFLEKELKQINGPFIKNMTQRLPFVVAKSAQTLDGKIATASGQSKWITSEESRRFARRVRNEFDAILVGINTVLKDDPSLNAASSSKRIKKVIVDSSLRVSPKAKLFKRTRAADCFIATTRKASKTKLNLLKKTGINVIICPERHDRVNLRWLLKKLMPLGVSTLLIEGGAAVIGSALKENLVDKVHVYIAPKIMGDDRALDSFIGFNPSHVTKMIQLKDVHFQKIGKDIRVEAYV